MQRLCFDAVGAAGDFVSVKLLVVKFGSIPLEKPWILFMR